jgi:hypothetical protein
MQEEREEAFERFMEQKWRDALNLAPAELVNWEAEGARSDQLVAEKQAANPRKPWSAGSSAGVATVEAAPGDEVKRRCQFFPSLGCD